MRPTWFTRSSRRVRLAPVLALALLTGWPAAAAEPKAGASAPATAAKKPAARAEVIQATSPPFTEGIFPCSGCHDGKEKVNTARRDLGFHDEQQSVFAHDAEHRWCLDCHDAQRRDQLHLTNGDLVPFTESYRLCGQCHGDKLRDWRVGVHGKRIGNWDGARTTFLCVNCHNPHTPLFKGVKETMVDGKLLVMPTLERIKPEPRPRRPEEVRP
jgi:hypothetical protein